MTIIGNMCADFWVSGCCSGGGDGGDIAGDDDGILFNSMSFLSSCNSLTSYRIKVSLPLLTNCIRYSLKNSANEMPSHS